MKLMPMLAAAMLALVAAPALAGSSSDWTSSHVPVPPSQNPVTLDLSDLDLPQQHPECSFDFGTTISTKRHYVGVTPVNEILWLANQAETITDGGRNTKKLSSTALHGLRRGMSKLLNSDIKNLDDDVALLAPHEAITLCEISMRLIGKNVVSFR